MHSVLALISKPAAPSSSSSPSPSPSPSAPSAPAPVLMVRPLACLADGARAAGFTAGLSEELLFRLYRDMPAFALIVVGAAGRQRASHVFEGTVRQHAHCLRVSLQLHDGGAGTMLWRDRFDSAGDGSIAAQEQLAERCVRALRLHLAALV